MKRKKENREDREILGISFSKEVIDKIRKTAKDMDLTISAFVRQCVIKELKRLENKEV